MGPWGLTTSGRRPGGSTRAPGTSTWPAASIFSSRAASSPISACSLPKARRRPFRASGASSHKSPRSRSCRSSPGHNFDTCPPEAILKLASVENGRIVMPGGASYRILALPRAETMTPAFLRKIKSLVEAGATVVGSRPSKSPSLVEYPKCDEEVRELADALWGDDPSPGEVSRAQGRPGRHLSGRRVPVARSGGRTGKQGHRPGAMGVAERGPAPLIVRPGSAISAAFSTCPRAVSPTPAYHDGRQHVPVLGQRRAGSCGHAIQQGLQHERRGPHPARREHHRRLRREYDRLAHPGRIDRGSVPYLRRPGGRSSHRSRLAGGRGGPRRVAHRHAPGGAWSPALEQGQAGVRPWGDVDDTITDDDLYPRWTPSPPADRMACRPISAIRPSRARSGCGMSTARSARRMSTSSPTPSPRPSRRSAPSASAGRPEIWHPDSGRIERPAAYDEAGGLTRLAPAARSPTPRSSSSFGRGRPRGLHRTGSCSTRDGRPLPFDHRSRPAEIRT